MIMVLEAIGFLKIQLNNNYKFMKEFHILHRIISVRSKIPLHLSGKSFIAMRREPKD